MNENESFEIAAYFRLNTQILCKTCFGSPKPIEIKYQSCGSGSFWRIRIHFMKHETDPI